MKAKWNQKSAEQEVLARIGATLIQIQRTELFINACVQTLLPNKDLSTLWVGGRRPMLGPLLKQLKEHTTIAKDFELTLRTFLIERNRFIHNLEFQPGWTFLSEVGIKAANRYLDRIERLEHKVSKAFTRFHKAYTSTRNDGAKLKLEIRLSD